MVKAQQIENFLLAISHGMSPTDACVLERVSRAWYDKRMQNDAKFRDDVYQAEMKCKQRNILIIQNAAKTSWQAGAWWLERKHKAEYATRQEHTGADGSDLIPKPILGGISVSANNSNPKTLKLKAKN